MNERLPVVQKRDLIHFDEDKVSLIKRTVAKNASNDQLALFLHQCQKTGLDPLARQIYCVMRWNKKDERYDMSIQTAIDGYRLIADRTDKYAGSDDYLFNQNLTQYDHMNKRENRQDYPTTATVTIYKLVSGIRVPFTATAAWESYYPGDGPKGFMWRKFQYLMIGKCAEGLALRKAFPAELSGVYIREEMEQAGFVDIADVEPKGLPPTGTHWVQGADLNDAWIEDDEPAIEESDNPELSDNGKKTKLMAPVKFVEYVCEKLDFNDPQHVRATMKLLGIKAVPQDAGKRKMLYEALEAYRHLRDERGLEQDDALAALQDEPKATTKTDTQV